MAAAMVFRGTTLADLNFPLPTRTRKRFKGQSYCMNCWEDIDIVLRVRWCSKILVELNKSSLTGSFMIDLTGFGTEFGRYSQGSALLALIHKMLFLS